ncbi:putative DYW domain-containing protein [Rosa chinensis]|uniref:Putative DYW domain-containing protein n=1 Tax=Rosa chinensis TaxID=74649 RepID=A0A2P6PKR1_ROSCH|nr:putative DYW domain-containing protein [Rosa chinensis]
MKFEMGIEPNEVTLISVVSACASSGAVDEGMYIPGLALKLGVLWEPKLVNSLINLYGKLGYWDAVCRFVETMPIQNVVSWNLLMIAIYAQNGSAADGLNFFNLMRRAGVYPDDGTLVSLLQVCENLGLGNLAQGVMLRMGMDEKLWRSLKACMVRKGVQPDHVTFTHLLSACSHSGLIKEGRNYFDIMSEVYGVEPRLEHYSCMVDLLGRCGLLHDAYELIKRMPMEPNSGVWGALFGACRVHGNIELGKEVAERLFALEPSDSRNYIMLSNVYSAAGLWRDASKVRALMKEKDLARTPGAVLLNMEIKFIALLWAVKEDMISKHSEKLAIAFGLLVINAGMPMIITMNLRIFGVCHGAAKFISLIEKRTIIIRDSKRFHHFTNGICTRGDYW